MKFWRLLSFYKHEYEVVFYMITLVVVLIISCTSYLIASSSENLPPSLITWISVLFRDITTAVYFLPILFLLGIYRLLADYFNRWECRIRFISEREFLVQAIRLLCTYAFFWLFGLSTLVFLYALCNNFSVQFDQKQVHFLNEFYQIHDIQDLADVFTILLNQLAYFIFLCLILLVCFSRIRNNAQVLAVLSCFQLVQSLLWMYPLPIPAIHLLPIFQYMEHKGVLRSMAYWSILIGFGLFIAMKSVRLNWRGESHVKIQ